MNGQSGPSGIADLNTLLAHAGFDAVRSDELAKFETYLTLILRWNARMNLTAVRDAEGIMRRHFVESIACAHLLAAGIHSLLDYGSGAGFPGIPIAVCRPEISVTLAESQGKKAAFLREAVRTLELNCSVWPRRAEEHAGHFDCVILRAVDRMDRAVAGAAKLVSNSGRLAILTTDSDAANLRSIAGAGWDWCQPLRLPGSEQRVMQLGAKLG